MASPIPQIVSAHSTIPSYVQPSLTSPEMQMIGATADPNSIGAVAEAAQVLQAQAVADSQFDPAVPARPKLASGFANPQPPVTLILIVIALLIGLYFYVSRPSAWTLIVGSLQLCLKPVMRFLRL
jgi:hypothetical protein